MTETVQVISPASLPEALRQLAEGGPAVKPLAGGTDAVVKQCDRLWRPRVWVNLMPLAPELAYIRQEDEEIVIGALTTFGDLLRSPLLQSAAPLLLQAASRIGGPQVRNMGTLGGNLGTASPAGDSLPALCALDARVRLVSLSGERELPVTEFLLGPGRTALAPGELIAAVRFRAQAPDERSTFEKLGLRAAHAISLVSAAIRLGAWAKPGASGKPGRPPGQPAFARVALGAVAPTVIRVPEAEAILTRDPITPDTIRSAACAAGAVARPISDLRATAGYRRAMAESLLLRGLTRLTGGDRP